MPGQAIPISLKDQFIGACRLEEENKGTVVVAELASKFGIKERTAQRTWVHYQRNGTVKHENHAGRKRKTTDEEDRELGRLAKQHRSIPFTQLPTNVDLCDRALRDRMYKQGLHRRVAQEKPDLDDEDKQVRLKWARFMKAQGPDFFKHVAFADETWVKAGRAPGREYVTREPGETYLEDCLSSRVGVSKHRGMGWGLIAWNRRGPFDVWDFTKKTMKKNEKWRGFDSEFYVQNCLAPYLNNFLDLIREDTGFALFQHDNSPVHKSRHTQRWITPNEVVEVFQPPFSPDTNPCEPCWLDVKRHA